jgi:hypothetical protein
MSSSALAPTWTPPELTQLALYYQSLLWAFTSGCPRLGALELCAVLVGNLNKLPVLVLLILLLFLILYSGKAWWRILGRSFVLRTEAVLGAVWGISLFWFNCGIVRAPLRLTVSKRNDALVTKELKALYSSDITLVLTLPDQLLVIKEGDPAI